MRLRSATIVMAWAVGALALWSNGSEPPPQTENRIEARRGAEGEWRRRGGPTIPDNAESSVSDDEIDKFMTQYSPKRWEQVENLPEERKANLKRFIRKQYEMMQRLKEENPEIYKLRLERLPVEDEMFRLSWAARQGGLKEGEESQLREQVRLFLDSSLEERRRRLERWEARLKENQAALESEKARLDEQMKHRDAMIERGVNLVTNQRVEELKRWAGPMFGQMRAFDEPESSGWAAPAATATTRPSEK